MVARAPAKLNLCLFLGGRRGDGLHELRSLFCPLVLSDRIVIEPAAGEADEVICAGVEGPNLVAVALEALRARGWDSPPLRIEIEKRIPVAAGLGGGSADAAAVLRLADSAIDDLAGLAAGLGADVPSQLDPRLALVSGAGERIEPLPAPGEFGVVLIEGEAGLDTGAVYARGGRARARARARRARAAGGGAAAGSGSRRLAARVPGAARQRPRAGGDLAAARDRRGARRAAGGRSGARPGHRLGADRGRDLRGRRRGRRGGGRAAASLRERDRLHAAAARIIRPCDWAAISRDAATSSGCWR